MIFLRVTPHLSEPIGWVKVSHYTTPRENDLRERIPFNLSLWWWFYGDRSHVPVGVVRNFSSFHLILIHPFKKRIKTAWPRAKMPAKSSLLRVCRCFWKVCVAHLKYFVQGVHSPRPSWYCQHLSLMLRSLALRKLDWSVLMPFFPSMQHKNVLYNSFFRTKIKLSELPFSLSSRDCLRFACDGVECPFKLSSPTIRDA